MNHGKTVSGGVRPARFGVALILALALPGGVAQAGEWSGEVAVEARHFQHDPDSPQQHDDNLSLRAEPEYYHDWDDGDQRFVFTPYLRLDQGDSERTHFDLRELYWRKTFESAELRLGIRKLFWGVTESQHLVDIINQTDLVENLDTEDKLGQPMAQLTFLKDWGTLDFFLMPYFRERTYQGSDGRLRAPFVVDTDNPVYESGAEETHLDLAVRYSHFIGIWDIGVAHFSGTSRDPRLVPSPTPGGSVVLVPHYDQIDQTSLDLQATAGDWLWKLELISRDTPMGRYTAATGGFEYTLVGLFDSAIDLGLLTEYLFDDRDEQATSPFQNDIFVGARLAFNDEQSTDLLAGVIFDVDGQARFFNAEGSRRLGQSWTLSLEVRIFSRIPQDDLLFGLRNDDYWQLELSKFF